MWLSDCGLEITPDKWVRRTGPSSIGCVDTRLDVPLELGPKSRVPDLALLLRTGDLCQGTVQQEPKVLLGALLDG